jgi:hypothetical protein
MSCSSEEARRALTRVLADGLAMKVDRNRDELGPIEGDPIVLVTDGTPEIMQEYISPYSCDFEEVIDVALYLQDDFLGQKDDMAGKFAGNVERIVRGNPTFDGVVCDAVVDPFSKSMPTEFGVIDTATVHVPVRVAYNSTMRSGGD